jgi:probable rRNA maturation factor
MSARRRRARPARAAAAASAITIVRRRAFAGLDDRALRRIVRAALAHGGRPRGAIGVVLMGDRELQELHGRFLGDPTPTDVLAFELGEGGGRLEGEVCCSVDCARRVARERGVPAERELALYVVHGVLHLCGYDDHAPRERARMRAAERSVLARLGFPDDPRPHP